MIRLGDPLTKKADLASGVGAGLIGFCLGAMLAPYARDVAIPIGALGLILHGWGMFAKHRLEERADAQIPIWSKALYWVCWLGLLVLAGYAFFRFWTGTNL